MGAKAQAIERRPRPHTAIAVDTIITELRVLDTTDRLLGLYELGLHACAAREPEYVKTVLEELIGCLDFMHYAEIAEGFHRIYSYCLGEADRGEFERVAFVLEDLRNTLVRAATDDAASITRASGE